MQFARNVDPGFDRTEIQMFSVDLGLQDYSEARGRLFQKELSDRLQSLPGVQSASLAYPLPLDAYNNSASVHAEGYVPRSDSEDHVAGLSRVGSHYFKTMGTRLVAGRPIDERDGESSRRVAVINESMARRYWRSSGQAVGMHFVIWDGPSIEVVGVAKDGKYMTFGENPTQYFFLPLSQHYSGRVTFLVRSKENPDTLISAIRNEVKSLDAALPIFGVRTMPQFLNRIVSVYEMGSSLVGTFAVTALLWPPCASTACCISQSHGARARSASGWPWVPPAVTCFVWF